MRCFFFWHKWQPIQVFHYNDCSYGGCVPSTKIIYRCAKCCAFEEEALYAVGHLSLRELFPIDKLPTDEALKALREEMEVRG